MKRPRDPRLMLAVVGFGVFIAADDLTVASTMLRQIVDDLHIALPDEFNDAAWIVNAYLIAYVAVMPFAGRLSDRWGRRPVFVGSLTLFAVGSAWLPFTGTLAPFLFARVMTAIGGGAMVPVALAAIGDAYPPERRGRGFGALAAIDTLGWVWGPLFGAFLVRFLDWRWQFYINVPLALIAIVLAWRILGPLTERSPRRLDLPGAIAFSIALTALTMGLLNSAELATAADLGGLPAGPGAPDWPLFVIAAIAGGYLVLRERTGADRLLGRDLFRGRGVFPALGANLLVGVLLAVALVNVPLFVNLVIETETGRAAIVSGWILTALTAAMAAASPLGGRVSDSRSPGLPALVGTATAAGALLVMGLRWEAGISPWEMGAHLAVLGAGVGLATPPLTAIVVSATVPERRGEGGSLVLISRLVGIALGLAGLTAWALHRFDELRRAVSLPPVTDPGYEAAARVAQADLTGTVLAETFLAAAIAAGLAVALSLSIEAREGSITGTG